MHFCLIEIQLFKAGLVIKNQTIRSKYDLIRTVRCKNKINQDKVIIIPT